ncbi:EF-hand domain-containing protein [Thiohalomonas denitrificans]|uniref:EF hand n=1 Tax=Thiohalomonas denitrificans TaxID=415747 RepID=A0A1G5PL19_9GAMM|nr:EF-hand domain-containing protein [Thiohalomonas denitrificans]SCZ50197.1 EF hand [Thiohalomonas denitrificans]
MAGHVGREHLEHTGGEPFRAPTGERLAEDTPACMDEGLAEFSELHQDGDGRISEDEAQQSTMLSERFDAADTDGDGSIDDAEFSAFEGEVSSPELSPEQEREEEAAEE